MGEEQLLTVCCISIIKLSRFLFQEASCRRKAVMAYFGEKRQACQAQDELPCDICKDRKCVLQQLEKLNTLQQSKSLAAACLARKQASDSQAKAMWQTGTDGEGRKTSPAGAKAAGCLVSGRSALRPVINARWPTTEATATHKTPASEPSHQVQPELGQPSCSKRALNPLEQQDQSATDAAARPSSPSAPWGSSHAGNAKPLIPVIKRQRYKVGFQAPRRA